MFKNIFYLLEVANENIYELTLLFWELLEFFVYKQFIVKFYLKNIIVFKKIMYSLDESSLNHLNRTFSLQLKLNIYEICFQLFY